MNLARTGWIEEMDVRFYPGYAKNWDDLMFRERILAELTAESVVLDLGAGAGIVNQMDFRGHAARICGIDLDSRVEQNPFLARPIHQERSLRRGQA